MPHYGLIPIQQPADIYDGYGHGGRGGWSWYTGSAARMLSAAYALIGIDKAFGEVRLADDAFEAKGGLQVEAVKVGEKEWRRALRCTARLSVSGACRWAPAQYAASSAAYARTHRVANSGTARAEFRRRFKRGPLSKV